MQFLLVIILFLLSSSSLLAQRIIYGEPTINKGDKEIKIPYTIEEEAKDKWRYVYDVNLLFTQEDSETPIFLGPLVSVTGDVGLNILSGEREITWGYLENYSTFDGERVRFKLDVTYRPNPLYLKGPEGALYSLILPGWGQTKVKPKARYWYATTIGTYALLGAGIGLRSSSNKNFDRYLASTTLEDTQTFFDRSNRQRRLSSTLLIAGASLWASDIIRVFLRGLKNKKEQKRLIKDYPQFQELIQKDPRLCRKFGKKFDIQCLINYDFEHEQPIFGMKMEF